MARPAQDQLKRPKRKGDPAPKSIRIPVRRDVKDTNTGEPPRRNNLSSGRNGTEPKLPKTKQEDNGERS